MYTEEFVLIPKQIYTREQPHVSQLLSNKNIRRFRLTLQWTIEVQ